MKKSCHICSMLIALLSLCMVASAQLGKDWAQATPHAAWPARYWHNSVVFDQRIWVLGGTGFGPALADAWWSSDGVKWTSATLKVAWPARFGHTSIVHDEKIWVLGGYSDASYPFISNDVWWSSDGVNWTSATLSARWSQRAFHASVVFGGKMWVIGGDNMAARCGDVWCSADGVAWTSATLSAPWGPRFQHAAVVHNGKIWILGGKVALDGGRSRLCNDVWWSADGATWTSATLSAPWSASNGHAAVVHDGKIWVIGGSPTSDVWYSTDGVQWTSATLSAPWVKRGGHTSVAHDGKIWILGGITRPDMLEAILNDVWCSPPPPPGIPTMVPEPAWTSGTANTVFWMAVANATTYTVQCDEVADFATPYATAGVSSTTLSHTFTGLVNGRTFWYRARAENVTSVTAWSSPTSSTQDAVAPTPPGPPTDAGAFTSSTSVRFNWTAATDPGTVASGIASYDLQVGTAPGQSNVFNANVGAVLTRTVTAPASQTVYARVRARDRAGNVGGWSSSSDGIVVDTTRPRLNSATARDYLAVDVTFSEAVAGAEVAANYTFTRGLRATQAYRLGDSQYRLYTTGQIKGTSYTVTVGASIRDRAGNSMDPSQRSRSFTGLGQTDARGWRLYR